MVSALTFREAWTSARNNERTSESLINKYKSGKTGPGLSPSMDSSTVNLSHVHKQFSWEPVSEVF